ncbi:MFS transporter [Paenibacillus rhizophilus]|uniref:MFS transporter n=1 Tax=Paenibacillus rhizophilus TaxID=1850366 RepID=A0A3N9Q4C8_9BACL|nr:MFS transporter [Paenibacillus rhizophilus]RQW13602.1 MFS transporter [Paenibacillus rhizophilus]
MTSSIAEIDSGRQGRGLSRGIILILAITSGLGVANLYYNQPLLADIGRAFSASPGEVGYVSMFTQVGYALGMLLFVPLGDIREKRSLISLLLVCVALSLVGFAESRSLGWMYFASFAIGFTTVVPQIIVPLAAQLAKPEERGKVIGTVMSGLLFGVLLARTVSGIVGDLLGWRSMYWIAAAFMLILALIMYRLLPASKPMVSAHYGELLRSMLQLVRKYATLREASLIGACMFGSFSVFWTSLTFFLEGPPYHYTSSIAGLFGLVGVTGAAGAPVVGRLADRVAPQRMIGVLVLLTLLSFVLFGLTGFSIAFLISGVVILDLGIQGTQVSNQARIYALDPAARSRINTVFMVSTFAGGSIGSTLGSFAWHTWGWTGVCLTGGGLVFAAFAVWSAHRLSSRKH